MNPHSNASTMVWRAMTPADLPAVRAIADQVHAAYPEDAAIFAERLGLFPEGCFVLVASGGASCGYVLSHSWRFAQPPALNALLGAIPAQADSYYIHDLALMPDGQGTGAAAQIVERLAAAAASDGFATLSLVAVNHSASFWRRQGFAAVDAPGLSDTLATYSAGALFMKRPARL